MQLRLAAAFSLMLVAGTNPVRGQAARNDGLTALEPAKLETAAAAFAGDPELKVSPAGTYVYAEQTFSEVIVAKAACLRISGGDCPTYRLTSRRYFPVNAPYFSKDDRFVYFAEMGLSERKTPNDTLTIREFEVERLIKGDKTPRRSFTLPGVGNIVHSIDIETDISGWPTAKAETYFSRVTPIVEQVVRGYSQQSDNVSNMFARLSGERSLILRRDDQDYFIHCSANGSPERLLWKNGSAFESRRANLPIRFDGKEPVALVSGGVLRLNGCQLRDETAGLSRALLVNGDDPSGYYGFATAEGIRASHVSPRLSAVLARAFAGLGDQHVMGIAINNRAGLAIVSHGPFFHSEQRKSNAGPFELAVAGYQHDLYFGGRKVSLVPSGTLIASHSVVTLDGGRLFVERYARAGNRKHVVFFYGGPGEHGNLERYAYPDMTAILDAGADLDIVHYGGSRYTFATKDRLFRSGTASLAADSKAIEDYVFARYGPEDFVALRLRSFGGAFYRFMSPRLLKRFHNVVLDAPAGSFAGYPWDMTPLTYKFNQMNLGEDTVVSARRYYGGLTGCQLVVKTVIIMGRKDAEVNPADDYRFCKGSDKLEMVYHDGDHLFEAPSANAARMAVYRMIAAKLVQE